MRALPGIREAGLTWVNPFTSRLRKVNMQTVMAAVPGQDAITRDNVTLRVDAVDYYRIIDPIKAIINVQNYKFAVSQAAQTSLRSVIGQSDMDQLLSDREKVNAHLKDVIDAPTEQPWGIRVERVEVKDVALPESMKRSMSRQAEAEREHRARIISADGEYQASKKLAQAAMVMASGRRRRTPAPRHCPCPKYPPSRCRPAPPRPHRSTPLPKHQQPPDRCHPLLQPNLSGNRQRRAIYAPLQAHPIAHCRCPRPPAPTATVGPQPISSGHWNSSAGLTAGLVPHMMISPAGMTGSDGSMRAHNPIQDDPRWLL